MNGGTDSSVQSLLELISAGEYDGVSISGGEPFLQTEELSKLLDGAKRMDMNTLVFTGFTFEELDSDPVMREPLKYIDLLVDGPYLQSSPSLCALTGSANQRVLKLEDGKVVADVTAMFYDCQMQSEVIISKDGKVTFTGLDDFRGI